MNELTRQKAPSSPAAQPATQTESRYDAHVTALHKKVRNFEYMNIPDLCPEALRSAREKLCSASSQRVHHSTIAGMQVVHEAPNPEFKSTNDEYWLTGFDEYVRILSADPTTLYRVSDILAWRVQVFSSRGVSTAQKIIYAKEFMFTYRGPANANAWCEKFANDHVLRSEFLIKDQQGPRPSRYSDADREAYNKSKKERPTRRRDASRRDNRGTTRPHVDTSDAPYDRRPRDHGQGARRGRDTDRTENDRSSRDDRGGNRDRNDRGQPSRDRPCRSRVGKAEVCAYGDRCKFSHRCIFCPDNKSHSAKECPSWNAEQAAAANTKYAMRIQL